MFELTVTNMVSVNQHAQNLFYLRNTLPEMRAYPFKRGYKPTEERLEEMIIKHFGEFRKDGDYYIVSFGAIEELRMKLEGKKLMAETRTNPKAPDDVAIETIKKYNRFLQDLTGYSAKERQKLMKKEVEKG